MQDEKFVKEQDNFEADGEEMDFNEFIMGGNFVKSPKIGESVEFTISKIIKKKEKTAMDPIKKKPFRIGLSKVDYYYDIETVDGKTYTPLAWEVVGKIKGIGKKIGHLQNVTLKVTHLRDGRIAGDTDTYKVEALVDGKFRSLDRESGQWSG